jgi:alanine racemase
MTASASPAPAGARITVDLAALAANWKALAGLVAGGGHATAAVVKGDGYGTGLERAASALAAAGATTFFVALPDEGVRLRAAVPAAVIYVLDGLIGGAGLYADADLRPVLGSWPEVEEWLAFRKAGGTTGAALHVDTGMNRLGLTLHEALELRRDERTLRQLAPDLIVSHLACADTPDDPMNRRQLALFREVRNQFPDIAASLANSAGVFLGPDYHFDLVRPGIALYGGVAVTGVTNPMRPVVTLEARVIAVREVDEGESVGYGATEHVKQPTRIAILALGYADGYHRAASGSDAKPGAAVWIRGQRAPLVGRVSMDVLAVDVTRIPGAARGDWAEMFGRHIPVDEVARHAGTIGYELLTGLGRRLERRYIGGDA